MAMNDIFVTSDMSVAHIQGLIDDAEGATTVHLGAGTYTFSDTLVIDRSDVSLSGAGDDQTLIVADASMASDPVIQVGHDVFSPNILDEFKIAAPAVAGDSSIELEADHELKAGDYVYVTQENTDEFFEEIGDELWQKDSDLRTILLKVSEVDGNTISFNGELNFDYDPDITTVEHREILEGNELSGFTVQGSWGEADPGEFSNTLGTDNGATAILLAGTSNAELSEINILDAASHGITIAGSTDVVLEDILVDGSADKGAGGNGYGIWIRDVYDSDFSDLTITDVRHAVVFASYTSASGNVIELDYTNRDINFHGGLDTDNIVTVNASIRTGEETSYMSPTVFFNSGTTYGAPTNADANTVVFGTVVGTVRGDIATSSESGSYIELLGGSDIAVTGDGDDYVDMGSGQDTVFASEGHDTLIGGSSYDRVYFENDEETYSTQLDGDNLIVSWGDNSTSLSLFEEVHFADNSYDFVAVPENTEIGGLQWEEGNGEQSSVVSGGASWEREAVSSSSKMGEDLNGLLLQGAEDLDVFGNDLDNSILANKGDNWLQGDSGNDRIFARAGDDVLFGGDGDDLIHGQAGDDVLIGGNGTDTLIGGRGADVFVFSEGRNIISDFNAAEGDTIQSNTTFDEDPFTESLNVFINTGESSEDYRFDFTSDGLEIYYDDDGSMLVKDTNLYDFLL
ncbi:MAG: hypothetical protein ABJN34_03690 [Litoreibacter sp.]|uniref:hypothetical protein n=1 Tax=Litoreibacter sp. TaxID=1969459 RepID=UPI003296EE1B